MTAGFPNNIRPDALDNLTQDHLTAGIKWLSLMSKSDKWNLSAAEVADLLGGISVNTYYNLVRKAEKQLPIKMTRDMKERLSLLLGIWKSLQLLVPNNRQDLAYSWFSKTTTSHILMHQSIKNYLIEQKRMEAFYVVKRFLNAQLH